MVMMTPAKDNGDDDDDGDPRNGDNDYDDDADPSNGNDDDDDDPRNGNDDDDDDPRNGNNGDDENDDDEMMLPIFYKAKEWDTMKLDDQSILIISHNRIMNHKITVKQKTNNLAKY